MRCRLDTFRCLMKQHVVATHVRLSCTRSNISCQSCPAPCTNLNLFWLQTPSDAWMNAFSFINLQPFVAAAAPQKTPTCWRRCRRCRSALAAAARKWKRRRRRRRWRPQCVATWELNLENHSVLVLKVDAQRECVPSTHAHTHTLTHLHTFTHANLHREREGEEDSTAIKRSSQAPSALFRQLIKRVGRQRHLQNKPRNIL